MLLSFNNVDKRKIRQIRTILTTYSENKFFINIY